MEAKRLMRLVNVEALKRKLEQDGEEMIGYVRLLDASERLGVVRSREEAAAFVRVLDEAGVILLFRNKVYLHPNKALDTFNTAVVSPVYYAMFTILTILASAIMFKDWSGQSASNIASEICGLITEISGTTVLHSTREPDPPSSSDLYTPLPPKIYWHIQGNDELGKLNDEDLLSGDFVAVVRQNYFT